VKNTNAVIGGFCPVVVSTLCISFNNKPLEVGIAKQFQFILIRRVGFFFNLISMVAESKRSLTSATSFCELTMNMSVRLAKGPPLVRY